MLVDPFVLQISQQAMLDNLDKEWKESEFNSKQKLINCI